jgi:hypothetical protein
VILTRTLTLSFATVAMLAAPMLQDSVEAQGRRGVRVAAVPRRGGVVVGAYYRPLFFSPFYDPFYDPWFPYRYGWYPPFAYGPQYYNQESSLRLQVTPNETEVFVDGYFAGTVDDYDGVFQRLRLEPGEHDVTLYMVGHKTVTQKILLQPGGTFRVKHTMEPLAAGETPEPRPVAPAGARPTRQAPAAPAARGGGPDRQAPRPGGDAAFGGISIRVQPADAEVLIDGERWEGPASDEALVVQVAPGSHRIEVRKDGYRGYTAQVEVGAGQTAPINVSLPRQ